MGKFQRRILIALLLSVSVLALWGLFELYRAWYETLVAWQVHGLFFMWLLAFALSILCAPFFMQSAGSKEEYEQSGALEITKLYLLVLGHHVGGFDRGIFSAVVPRHVDALLHRVHAVAARGDDWSLEAHESSHRCHSVRVEQQRT